MAFTDYDKCALLLPMDGSNNGTTFTDWSPNPKTVTVAGNAKTVIAQSKYYGSSGYFDGSGDYLSVADHADVTFGSGDFTISAYIRPTSYPANHNGSYESSIVTKDLNTAREFAFNAYGTASSFTGLSFLGFENNTTYTEITGTGTINLNQWHHTALVRSGNNIYLFLDGVLLNSGNSAFSRTLQNTTTSLKIGAQVYDATYTYYFSGYIQDLLIIKGVALWTSDFTPPTRLIGKIAGNVKDINGNNANRIIHAIPRSNPTRIFSTTSDGITGNYTLRVPATIDVSRIVLADEVGLYNDKIDRIIPE